MHFFFYGTLIAGSSNAVARSVHARLRPLGRASVRGALHAIPDPQGWYPALLPGHCVVAGMAYAALPDFSAADLALLDDWEDCDSVRPGESLYLRQPLVVTMADGTALAAQGYAYAQPLPNGAIPVPGGDFAAWLAARGGAAFA